MDHASAQRMATRRALQRSKTLPLTMVCLLLGGCSQFKEVHYLKSTVPEGQTPNYFRVNVDGWTFMSSSRYTSGYFDEAAVDTYFGGIKQPPDEEKIKGVATKDSSGDVKPIAGDGGGTLILLLSSNADDIANSLNALASSDAITQALAGIMSKDRLEAAEQAKADAPAQEATGTALATLGDALIPAEPAAGQEPPVAAVRANLLAYANALANSLSPGTHFDSLADAQAWVRARPQVTSGTEGSR